MLIENKKEDDMSIITERTYMDDTHKIAFDLGKKHGRKKYIKLRALTKEMIKCFRGFSKQQFITLEEKFNKI